LQTLLQDSGVFAGEHLRNTGGDPRIELRRVVTRRKAAPERRRYLEKFTLDQADLDDQKVQFGQVTSDSYSAAKFMSGRRGAFSAMR
jgi:hypothetical protein